MCCCDKPNVNGQPGYKWQPQHKPGIRPVDPPALEENDKLLYDEPGRCGGDSEGLPEGRRDGLDCHSHHFRLVRRHGRVMLLVRHGSGDEAFSVSYTRTFLNMLAALDSDARYWVFHALQAAHDEGEREATDKCESKWRRAAAEKRIRTRKQRGQSAVKVWIEPVVEKRSPPYILAKT